MTILLNKLYNLFLTEEVKKKIEKKIILFSIISFLIHLLLIVFNKSNIIKLDEYSKFFDNPIAAIYTPFSFILVYEVYLLVFYIPQSTSTYIGKQYEIILLITLRRLFKDISNLQLTNNWFNIKSDVVFVYDLIAVILLFYLILIFYKLANKGKKSSFPTSVSAELAKFIKTKKIIATLLIPILLILVLYSFGKWLQVSFFSINKLVYEFKDVNKIFFDDFFMLLILVDVFLLLFSFFHSDKFSVVIRNSGFLISTIMIRLSFSTDGLLNIILLVASVLFGIIIFATHNQYEKLSHKTESSGG